MSTIFHRQALQKSGCLQPDLNGLNDIMSLLREKSILQSDVLQPLLAKYLPFYAATDLMFIVNFRLQAQHWLVTNGDKELTMEEARHLSSKRRWASKEFLLKDDNPMLKQNLTALLRKVMQEDSSTWDALGFLDQTKKANPALIIESNMMLLVDPKPSVGCYPRCAVIFYVLESASSWTVRNDKTTPLTGLTLVLLSRIPKCKFVVLLRASVLKRAIVYIWIILMLVKMEPRFTLSFIDIIFGNQGLTDPILIDLDIVSTCILRGNYHHLINKVWPHTFGTHSHQKIR
jgi:hypothetical protein